ncbi:MAG: NADH-quinone oxidoreductase subunit NuoH [Symbiobacteriia bacterium]
METLWVILIRSLVLMLFVISMAALLTLFERKFLGYFQYRVGPNRVGPWGLLQPIADVVKTIFKEDIVPKDADRFVFMIAPVISLFVALGAFAVIPVGPPLHIGGLTIPLSAAAPGAGMLVYLAIVSLGVYGVALGGWASQSKYSLLGSLRGTAQMISYELAMGMSLVSIVVTVGSLLPDDIIAYQHQHLPLILMQPIAFLIFFISLLAEGSRTPFDLTEAETELVGGYNTEYSGLRFALFFLAEYVAVIVSSALVTTLFLGGWWGPFLPGFLWFFVKTLVMIFVFVWIRATLPRLRYDQLMSFGWKVLLPVAAANLLVTSVFVALH